VDHRARAGREGGGGMLVSCCRLTKRSGGLWGITAAEPIHGDNDPLGLLRRQQVKRASPTCTLLATPFRAHAIKFRLQKTSHKISY
jgi:hypothetical protein